MDDPEQLELDALLRVSSAQIPAPLGVEAPRWTLQESALLVDLTNSIPSANINWDDVSRAVGKPSVVCQAWFQTLHALKNLVPDADKTRFRIPKKRKRRTAQELERKYFCSVEKCKKGYGTEGALKRHMKRKHPDVPYVPTFLKPYLELEPEDLEKLTVPLKPGTSPQTEPDRMDQDDDDEDEERDKSDDDDEGSDADEITQPTPLTPAPQTLVFNPASPGLMQTIPQQPIALTTTELPSLNAQKPRRKKAAGSSKASASRGRKKAPETVLTPTIVTTPGPFASPTGSLDLPDPTQVDIQKLLAPIQAHHPHSNALIDPQQIMSLLQRPMPTEGVQVAPVPSGGWLSGGFGLPSTPTVFSPGLSLTSSGNFPPPKALTTTELPPEPPQTIFFSTSTNLPSVTSPSGGGSQNGAQKTRSSERVTRQRQK
eukprot:TRINITY_DN5162_c0_g1_i3.p1 TRINITY_DN5162_c0_g1~~TRINITY_DN5162_c0_g1_i3.p1  ORF type:complete len:428 (+),score=72.70 TRINITY_DN5162_c0_g1_i3:137-1420(+)